MLAIVPRAARGAAVESVLERVRSLRAGYRALAGRLSGLPSVLIVGAQKAGTTSLYNYLIRHPAMLAPATKEIHYFDLNYHRRERWYRGHFPRRHRLRDGVMTLDASPYYLAHPLAAGRAVSLLPEAKLIVLLRNPVDRAFSHYHHEVRGGRETLSFEEALEREPERLAGEEERLCTDPAYRSTSYRRYSYLRRGLYLDQLQRWSRYYPRAQMLILQSEWMFRDAAAATLAVQEFLGLPSRREADYRVFLAGNYGREMPQDIRRRLLAHFAGPNRELYRWLGREFDWA